MPAQQGLGADQEGPPGRAREDPAESGEDQAIGWPEAGQTNLALKDMELLTEGENLDL